MINVAFSATFNVAVEVSHYIKSEFASAKAGILGAPPVSNTEMDLEGWNAIEQFPFKSSKEIVGAVIAYKFDAKDGGWARGTVKSLAKSGENAGMYGVQFVI